MGTRLFIGGLTPNMTEDDLAELFGKFGELHDTFLVMDRETGRSRQFGFVEFKSEVDAATAVRTLHKTEVNGRQISVQEATERRTKDA